ncbi:MAG: non-canonical purine NTP pyrophosphatase [Candidatus Micrarchaeota archaeon]
MVVDMLPLKKIIRFASSNPEKIIEVSKILGKKGIRVIPISAELNEIRSEDQEEVAKAKARTAYGMARRPVIAEDTGVYFEAYANFPGAFPSFVYRSIGYAGILNLLAGRRRGAFFKTIVAYYDGKITKTFIGRLKGVITPRPDLPKYQNPKLPYEAIFRPQGSGLRLCRLTKEEKNSISHRGKATRAFAKWYLEK